MGDLEEKVKNLLASPDGIEQILGMAKNFGFADSSEAPQSAGLLDGFDPKQVSLVMDLLHDYQSEDDRRIRLLRAMSEYVKPEERTHMERAMQLVKLSKVAKRALHGMRGGENDV